VRADLFLAFCVAGWLTAGVPPVLATPPATGGSSDASTEEAEALKQDIEATREALAAERERGLKLQRRLSCSESQLREYAVCRERFENGTDDFWRCVERALSQIGPCQPQ
jgi:hypothetical protein